MKTLAVITARGGSVRLPNKNLALLGGKPLIAWSIEVGKKACDHLVLSTDAHPIAVIAEEYGCNVIMRPLELRGDANHMDVLIHAAKNAKNSPYNAVLLLQPTSPFRTVDDVKGAIRKMEETGAETVVSIVPKSNYNSYALGKDDRIRQPFETDERWQMNGAVYLITWKYLMEGGNFDGPHNYGYRMPPERSIDIDFQTQLDEAEAMLDADGKFDPEAIAKKVTAPA